MTIFNLEASNIIDLQLKLDGKLSIDRDELLALVNSWGRNNDIFIKDKNDNKIFISCYEIKEKYDLSNLDVSEITNFDDIFRCSKFYGNINDWDVSNVTSMKELFAFTENFDSPLDKWNVSKVNSLYGIFNEALSFNQDLNSWDITNVTNMGFMFYETTLFNKPVLWDLSNIIYMDYIFTNAKYFKDKFNNGKNLPTETNKIKEWLKQNKELMIALNIEENKSKELDKFLLNFDVIDSANLNGLYNNENKEIK